MSKLEYKTIKEKLKGKIEKHTKDLQVEDNHPILVVFDSANLSGKTTIVEELKERMLENGFTVSCYKQPYYSANRKKLLSGELGYLRETDLFYNDRLNLLVKEIWKSKDDVILLDRSWISSLLYQGIKQDDLDNLCKIAEDSLDLYKQLNLKMDIGVNLYADPKVMSDRFTVGKDVEFDYRDNNDVEKIKQELEQYEIAWQIGIDIGLVDLLYTTRNNDMKDMNNIVDTLDLLITNKIEKRDINKMTKEEDEELDEYLD